MTNLQPHISNVVVSFTEDSTWALRDPETHAIWGKVLTDGVHITSARVWYIYFWLLSVKEVFYNATIVVKKSEERSNPDRSHFRYLDLACAQGYNDNT